MVQTEEVLVMLGILVKIDASSGHANAIGILAAALKDTQ